MQDVLDHTNNTHNRDAHTHANMHALQGEEDMGLQLSKGRADVSTWTKTVIALTHWGNGQQLKDEQKLNFERKAAKVPD
jgi:hypothetical protein